MFGIGGWEMLLIGVVALLVFGPKRLPELARSMGKGLAEFRRASSDLRRSMDLDFDPKHQSAPDPETQPPAQAGQPNELPATLPNANSAVEPESPRLPDSSHSQESQDGPKDSSEHDERPEANGGTGPDRGSSGGHRG